MWVYIRTEPGLHTVGFYDPDGKWHTDSDGTKEECAKRVHYLNGGGDESALGIAIEALATIANESYDSKAQQQASHAMLKIMSTK